jgi:uncharacterized membrane protein
MLKEKAWANALAVTTGVIYIVFYVIDMVATEMFAFIFNAQFLGADITSLVPEMSFGGFISVLITVVITAWIMGYIWAKVYNKFAK